MEEKGSIKVTATGRIPLHVRKFCQAKGISIADLMMEGYYYLVSQEKDYAQQKLIEAERDVIHWRSIVLQHDNDCNKKVELCNTIRKEFSRPTDTFPNGRGQPGEEKIDKDWLKTRLKRLQDESIYMTVDELYDFCTSPDPDTRPIREVHR